MNYPNCPKCGLPTGDGCDSFTNTRGEFFQSDCCAERESHIRTGSEMEELRKENFQLREERDKFQSSLEFSRSWWAAREGRVSQWVRDNQSALPEELVHQWFSIWANGTKDPMEPPTYASRMNRLEHERDKLAGENRELMEALRNVLGLGGLARVGDHRESTLRLGACP